MIRKELKNLDQQKMIRLTARTEQDLASLSALWLSQRRISELYKVCRSTAYIYMRDARLYAAEKRRYCLFELIAGKKPRQYEVISKKILDKFLEEAYRRPGNPNFRDPVFQSEMATKSHLKRIR